MIKNSALFALACAVTLASCRDASAPRPVTQPRPPAFVVTGPQTAISGKGAFGTAAPGSGADRQDFDFTVSENLTGRVLFNEYLYNAWVKVDTTDAQTKITAFRSTSALCGAGMDPANGAEVDGVGRREDGQLQNFTLVACDNGPSGSGADFFKITFSTYVKQGNPPSGDIVKTIAQQAQTGSLDVTTSTTGSNVPSGYTVTVDGNTSQPSGINATVTFAGLAAGSHTVVLSGVPANCTVSGSATQTVTVTGGQTATAAYSVSCVTPPGSLAVTTSTSGTSLPSAYTLTVDGSQSRAVGINATTTFTSLAAGSHSVVLSGVPSNCTLSGSATQTVTVPSGATATASYSVNCITPNTTPTVSAGSDEKVLLGLLYSLKWSFADPDNGPWQYTISWGDGSSTSGTATSAGNFSNGHTYLLGTFTIKVTVTDAKGASSSATKKVSVITGLLGL